MTPLPTNGALSSRADYEAALPRLREASRAYYGGDDSPLDNATYDRLRLAVLAWETANPDEIAPAEQRQPWDDSVCQTVSLQKILVHEVTRRGA
ncbi:hypothetical protein [Streptomyces sanglieri]|uniref:hypothetical protein n=1 Tax=Streptomyces sanglieri TaxID=193460 RepID=UPI0035260E6D